VISASICSHRFSAVPVSVPANIVMTKPSVLYLTITHKSGGPRTRLAAHAAIRVRISYKAVR
jgi:hypothetical protein